MKFASVSIKPKHITIDQEYQSSASDIDSSNDENSKNQKFVDMFMGKSNQGRIGKFRITPIRREPSLIKNRRKKKIETIQIQESEGNQSKEMVRTKIEPIGNFKRKLLQISNKCKIQGKQHSQKQCSICLTSFQNKSPNEIGLLPCNHLFCFECIYQNSNFSTKCPYCRSPYSSITRNDHQVVVQQKQNDDEQVDDEPCYVCGRNDDFEHLLQCQYCEAAFCHTYCDERLESDALPQGSWFCLSCSGMLDN